MAGIGAVRGEGCELTSAGTNCPVLLFQGCPRGIRVEEETSWQIRRCIRRRRLCIWIEPSRLESAKACGCKLGRRGGRLAVNLVVNCWTAGSEASPSPQWAFTAQRRPKAS